MADTADTQNPGTTDGTTESNTAASEPQSEADAATSEAPPAETKKEKEKQGAYGKDIPVSLPAQIASQEDLEKVLEEHSQWIASVVNPRSFIGAGRANLSHIDLRPYELSGRNLSGANLRGANMRGMDLAGVNLTACNLRDADLTAASLRNAKLSRAKVEGAVLSRADLTDAVLGQNDLEAEEILKLSEQEIDYGAAATEAIPDPPEEVAATIPDVATAAEAAPDLEEPSEIEAIPEKIIPVVGVPQDVQELVAEE